MEERRRILFVLNCYRPTINGVVASADSSAGELERQGYQVRFVVPKIEGAQDTDQVIHCPGTIRTQHGSFPFIAWPSPRMLWRIWKFRPQVIHLHHCFGVCVVGWLLGHLLGVPIIYQNHTMIDRYGESYAPRHFRAFAGWLGNRWNAFFANRCNLVLVPGEAMRGYLAARGVKSPIRVTPTGIDTNSLMGRDCSNIRQRLGLPEEIPLITYAGRVGVEKNVPLLTDLIAALAKKRGRTFRFVIAGPGPLIHSAREDLAWQGFAGYATFTGGIPHDQVLDLLCESELFVFPSVTETQGLVTLEAMACSLAVVGANAMGTADLVRDGQNGYLVEMDQDKDGIVAAFVEAIDRLLNDEELRTSFGRVSRQMAETYDLSACVRRITDAYHEL